MAIINKSKTKLLAKMWRKGTPCVLLLGLQIGTVTMKNSLKDPQKIKNRTTL